MTLSVSDLLSNLNDQVVNSARLMGRSKHRQSIFDAVYRGQKQQKSVREIMATTGLSQIRVLNEGKRLGHLLEKVRGGFRKKKELAPHYKKILMLARNPKKLVDVPTKVSPKIKTGHLRVTISIPKTGGKAHHITIEDIDSFSKATKRAKKLGPVREDVIKTAFAKIFGEGGKFKDWGGEKSDLYTTKSRVRGKRRPMAIAFKGRGTGGKLVPAKMGKNGDQIGRLFDEPAEVFLVVYCGQIDSSIVSQMHAFAIAKKAFNNQETFYGIIDDDDLGRIAAGYSREFTFR
jgi:hypothetical protein